MFYIVASLVFILDQTIKQLVMSNIMPAQTVPFIRGILHFTYVRNTGVAFGLFPDSGPLLIIIGAVVSVLVIYFYIKQYRMDILTAFCLALILGGSLGNLYDRIFRGYVVDYIDFRFFPVFNFADISINAGVFLILIFLFFGRSKCTPSSAK